MTNPNRSLLWVIQNYQMIGFGLIIAGVASRITIVPDPIEIEEEDETGEVASEDAGDETSQEDKSFFTLYWLVLCPS